MVDHNSSSCGYGESRQKTKHPDDMHDDDEKVISGTEEHKIIQEQNDDEQLAAECSGIVEHQEIIGFADWHGYLLVTLSESLDIRIRKSAIVF